MVFSCGKYIEIDSGAYTLTMHCELRAVVKQLDVPKFVFCRKGVYNLLRLW